MQDFKEYYNEHYGIVAGILRTFPFAEEIRDEILQEVFFRAWQGQQQGRILHAGWLVRATKNMAIDEYRKLIKRRFVDWDIDDICPEYESPQQENAIHRKSVRTLLAQRPGPQGEVARQFYAQGVPAKDIARNFSMKVSTVLSHLRRFRIFAAETLNPPLEGVEN